MTQEHTAEPWEALEFSNFGDGSGHVLRNVHAGVIVATVPSFLNEINNARRIVACVNALAGVPTEALEEGAVRKLVEAARDAVSDHGARWGIGTGACGGCAGCRTRAALAPFADLKGGTS